MAPHRGDHRRPPTIYIDRGEVQQASSRCSVNQLCRSRSVVELLARHVRLQPVELRAEPVLVPAGVEIVTPAVRRTSTCRSGAGSPPSTNRQRIRDSIGDSARPSASGISCPSRTTPRSPACSSAAAASSSVVQVPTAERCVERGESVDGRAQPDDVAGRPGGRGAPDAVEHGVVRTRGRRVHLQPAHARLSSSGRAEEVQRLVRDVSRRGCRSPTAGPPSCGRRPGLRRARATPHGRASGRRRSSRVDVDPSPRRPTPHPAPERRAPRREQAHPAPGRG